MIGTKRGAVLQSRDGLNLFGEPSKSGLAGKLTDLLLPVVVSACIGGRREMQNYRLTSGGREVRSVGRAPPLHFLKGKDNRVICDLRENGGPMEKGSGVQCC